MADIKTISDINFGELYRSHVKKSLRIPKGSQYWDKKAIALSSGQASNSDFHYLTAFLERMDLDGVETVLDVGCGSGTIALALAPEVTKVYALDYSSQMLALTQSRALETNISNCETILRSWDEDWSDIAQCDLCIASRSSMVSDLEEALYKLNQKAKKRVYMTMVMEKDPIHRLIVNLLKPDRVEFPSYIYAVNILYQQGYHVSVDFIEADPQQSRQIINNVTDFVEAAIWAVGDITKAEEELLIAYYQTHRHTLPLTYNRGRSWAFLKWRTDR